MTRLMSACLVLAVGCSAASRSSLPSLVPPRVNGASVVGRLPADTPLAFTVALSLRDCAGLDALLRDPTAAPLSPSGFGDRFAPAGGDYARVVGWLRGHNLTVAEAPSRATLRVSGAAGDVERALGTELMQYADARGQFFAPTALALDDSIAGDLAGISGLDDAVRWTPKHSAPMPLPDFTSGSADPGDLRALYNAPVGTLGDGETIAILGAGSPPDPKADVDGFIQKYTLPVPNRAAQYTQVLVGGANRDPAGLADNEYLENLTDIDMAMTFAPHADFIHVIVATNFPGLFNDGINYIVNYIPNAHQASVSFGTAETFSSGTAPVLNQLFAQAKAQGQQWFIATGDQGTNGIETGPGNMVPMVQWPASSPYVIAVGGTSLVLDSMNNPTKMEVAWDEGGGGESQLFTKPAFQIAQAGDTRPRTPADGVRDIPDVAALAGSAINVYGQGQLEAALGTSFATPMWAGISALLDQTHGGGGIRNFAENVYRIGATGGTGFNDITSGTNGNNGTNGALGPSGYDAGPGWDGATGWGTPNIPVLIGQW